MIDVEELKKLALAATPGSWETDDPWIVYAEVDGEITYLANTNSLDTDYKQREKDAAFIAAANPQTVLALLEHIRRLESAVIAQRKMLGICGDDELEGVRYRDHD